MAELSNFRRLRHGEPQMLPTLARAAARRRSTARWTTFWLVVIAFLASAAVGSLVLGALPVPVVADLRMPAMAVPAVSASFPLCGGGARQTCVVDGDTFWLGGQKYRIADIDTPEVSEPQCAAEKALGDRATQRLAELLNAGPFVLAPYERDIDRYGRKLRIVTRDGASLGQALVAEGLARRWDGARHPWC